MTVQSRTHWHYLESYKQVVFIDYLSINKKIVQIAENMSDRPIGPIYIIQTTDTCCRVILSVQILLRN